MAEQKCIITGCSGQICAEQNTYGVDTCEWKDYYACYRPAICTKINGKCGWKPTKELVTCLGNYGQTP